MTGLIMLFVGGIWKTFGLWTQKEVGYFKWHLMGHPIGNMEDSVKGGLNCRSAVEYYFQMCYIIFCCGAFV